MSTKQAHPAASEISTSAPFKRLRMPTSIILDPDVQEYVERLTKSSGRSRTWTINQILREHAHLTREKFSAPRLVHNPKELIINF